MEPLYIWDSLTKNLVKAREIPKMGIYSIVSGEHCYVGSSIDLEKRLRSHINTIFSHGVNGCGIMRTHVGKTGELKIYLLEEVTDINTLRILEEQYIDKLKPDCNGLNVRKNYIKMTLSIPEDFADKLDYLKRFGRALFDGIPYLSRGQILALALDEYIENHEEHLTKFFEQYNKYVGE